MKPKNQVPILVADDDMDDCQMIKEALQESRLINELHFVHNGEELMTYLQFKNLKENPIPGLKIGRAHV